ncbi:MAG: tetratricopeptide repeat protein [Acidobacteriota bacterium]
MLLLGLSQATSPDASALYERARAAFEDGQMEEAESLARQAIEQDSSLAAAYALRGVLLDQLGRAEEALESYLEAARLDPDDAEVHHNLCLYYNQREQYAEALQSGRKAVELNPLNSDSFNNLGRAALKLGEFEEARSALRKALEIDPTSMSAHYNLSLVLAEQARVAEAVEELEFAYQAAQQASDEYRSQWVVEVSKRLLNRYPGDGAVWRVHRLLGRIYYDRGRHGSAIPHLKIAAERRDFFSLLHLGTCYKNKALAQEAIEALRQAVRLRPDNYQAHNELGHTLGMLNEDWGAAEREFRAALEHQPDSPEVNYNLAYALFRLQHYGQARQQFQETFRLKPEMADSEHYKELQFPE